MNYYFFHMINQLAGHNHLLDAMMIFISKYALVVFAAILVIIWITGNQHSKRAVLYAGVSGVLALFINFLIAKVYFEPRPFVTHSVHLLIQHAKDASFPSDHTSGAFGLAIGMRLYKRKWGKWMLVFAALTGFSRIFVGHHYPGDVLGSMFVALVSSLVVARFRRYLEPIVQLIFRGYKKITSQLHFN